MHDRMLAEHGGSAGIRDENLLESALAKLGAKRTYYVDIPGDSWSGETVLLRGSRTELDLPADFSPTYVAQTA